MPLYDYLCKKCGIVEVFHGMTDFRPRNCTKCGRKGFAKQISAGAAFHAAPDSGWEQKNGGLGEYMPQMGLEYLGGRKDGVRNPATHCRTRAEAIDRFKRQGKDVEKC